MREVSLRDFQKQVWRLREEQRMQHPVVKWAPLPRRLSSCRT
jgi:hypothetical protein